MLINLLPAVRKTSEQAIITSSERCANQNSPGPGEQTTPGYGLANQNTGIRFNPNVTLAVAVDNLFDRSWCKHLTGIGSAL